MKRLLAMILVMVMLCMPVAAQSSLEYVTDFTYATIRAGGLNGAFVYGAYENNGADYKMGLLSEEGEQTRTDWSSDGWNALFAAPQWSVTVHEDAGTMCKYAASHTEDTLCPYRDVSLVTLTHTQTGTVLSEQYIYFPKKSVTSGGTVSYCMGVYGYRSPETLKYVDDGLRVALRNEQGLWGVYDLQTDSMLTEFLYENMSAVYGDYVKVFNGTAWGRLDLSGATQTVYAYATAEMFSVTEELREIGDNRYRVFNADNEPISAVYTLSATSVSYSPQARTTLCVNNDGTKTLLDLAGNAVAVFDKTQKIVYLDRACYAVEQYNERNALIGAALAQITDAVQPEDTVLAGDVNFDDVVDSADVRMMLKKTVDLMEFTDRQRLAADVTGDGKVNSADIRVVLVQINRAE